MKWVNVRGSNADFAKPRNWDEERDGPCGTLPVRVEPVGLYNYHYSAWKPDAEELALLNGGGVVELCCVGQQPPVSVGVVPEFIPVTPSSGNVFEDLSLPDADALLKEAVGQITDENQHKEA